ncbi:Sodium/calcium exchanger domain-containing protein [Trichoderma sp. SZMC 28014]
MNVLLVFVPLGLLAAWLSWNDVVVSAFNFLAIIPLSALISNASDTIGNRWGGLIGGLVNASFGNTVELIVGIMALSRGEIRVVQSILLGSILSDILLASICIIVATRGTGLVFVNSAVIDSLSSLMLITAVTLVLPTALYSTFPDSATNIDSKILSFSRSTGVAMLLLYIAYLYFQLKTHASLFMSEEDDIDHSDYLNIPETPSAERDQDIGGNERVDEDLPSILISGLLIGRCTYSIMESLDGMADTLGITKIFVALILMPMASNAPELTQVVAASRKKKINYAISVIIGSILQISLFVLPVLVIIGWILNIAMDLYFKASQTYILLFAITVVNQVLQDRQYTYLHGTMLLSV